MKGLPKAIDEEYPTGWRWHVAGYRKTRSMPPRTGTKWTGRFGGWCSTIDAEAFLSMVAITACMSWKTRARGLNIDPKDAERIIRGYSPRAARVSEEARSCLERADAAIRSCNSRSAMSELLDAMRFRETTDYMLSELVDQNAPDDVLAAFEYESLDLLGEIEERVEKFAIGCDCKDRITGKGFAGYSRH